MIVFIFGINDRGVARVKPDPSGQPNFDPDGTCAAFGNIDLGGQPFAPLLIYGPQDEQPVPKLPVKPTLVFNQIAEPDSHKVSLERCRRFCDGLGDVPVINHPDTVLGNTREQVSDQLAELPNVRSAQVIRCRPRSPQEVMDLVAASGIGFPCVFRTTGEHNAQNVVRLDSDADTDALHGFALNGTEHYLMEFLDTRDDRGLFVKHRVMMVDGEPFAKHTLFHDQWIVNSDAVEFMRANREHGTVMGLLEILRDEVIPAHRDTFRAIAAKIGLDYFGIDCHIAEDGTITVFEANANMGALKDTLRKAIPAAGAFDEALLNAVRTMMDQRSGYRRPSIN